VKTAFPLAERVAEICAGHGGKRVVVGDMPAWVVDTSVGKLEVTPVDRLVGLRFHEPARAKALGVDHFSGYLKSGDGDYENMLCVLDARLSWLKALRVKT
jgi:hypothetical protein